MIVLGVDPGYRNLGLSILRVAEDGSTVALLHSENMAVGRASAPMTFAKFLIPHLQALDEKYGPIEGVGFETPPFIKSHIKTTAFLWSVSSIIVAWAQMKGASVRHASPLSLKRGVCRVLNLEWDRNFIPKKSEVKKAVSVLLDETSATSHENDATFAALLLYTPLVPPAQ